MIGIEILGHLQFTKDEFITRFNCVEFTGNIDSVESVILVGWKYWEKFSLCSVELLKSWNCSESPESLDSDLFHCVEPWFDPTRRVESPDLLSLKQQNKTRTNLEEKWFLWKENYKFYLSRRNIHFVVILGI